MPAAPSAYAPVEIAVPDTTSLAASEAGARYSLEALEINPTQLIQRFDLLDEMAKSLELKGPVLLHHTYTSAAEEPDTGHPTFMQVAPLPMTDSYYPYFVELLLRPGDATFCFTPQPGMREYRNSLGLLASNIEVIEVSHPSDVLGFPCDPLTIAHDAGITFPNRPAFISTLPTAYTEKLAHRMGLAVAQSPHGLRSNNKAEFLDASARYGYPVFDSITLKSEADIAEVARRWGASPHGVVMRLSHGAGGDTVRFPKGDEASLRAELGALRKVCEQGFAAARFPDGALERYWPADSLLPRLSSVTISQHRADIGREVLNGSNTIIVRKDGSVEIPHYYKQVTENGIFLGSRPVYFHPSVKAAIDEQMMKVARYCREELNVFGVVGVDFMLVETPDGKLKLFLYELNGRPSASATAQVVADKLGARQFIQGTANHKERGLNTIEDARAAINACGKDYFGGLADGSRVVVTTLRSRWGRDGNGDPTLLFPANAMKILIIGETMNRCREILADLTTSGLSIS